MKSLAGVGVLEKMRAVEICQPVLVGREMRRHPIKDYAQAALVKIVDQEHEILRLAESGSRREVAGGLIAP